MSSFTKVKQPVKLLNVNVLYRCVKGLKRHIKVADNKDDVYRLEIIKDEIKGLIRELENM